MKLFFYTISVFSFLLVSFTVPQSSHSPHYYQTTDSLPEKNKQIIVFVKSKIKKKVGTGECWNLAAEALKFANATWDLKYKFGKEINYKKEPVFAGDIIQFEGIVLNYDIEGKSYTEKMAHHTAIIYEVNDNANFTIAHQNNGYSGRKVGVSPINLANITKGKFKIYRPVK